MLVCSLLNPGRKINGEYNTKLLNLIFLKMNFGQTGVYVLSSISRTFHNFYTGFFLMFRRILELKNDTSILRKNG